MADANHKRQIDHMNPSALRSLPISYNALVLERTSRCTAQCGMCYQSAGPKGSAVMGDAELALDDILSAISQAAAILSVGSRCHLAGGEAFIDTAQCLKIFAHARDMGFEDITTTTNAYWAQNRGRASRVCRDARRAGLLRMEISWDYWHSPYVSGTAIGNCLEACAEYGIKTNLRILATKTHSAQEALSQVGRDALSRCDLIMSGPVFPTGRADSSIPKDEIFFTGNLGNTCHSVLNLTINPTGRVYPCCAGADQTEALAFGNIKSDRLQAIVDRMSRSLLLRVLVFGGPGALLAILEEQGVDLSGPHANICHMCWEIFSNPRNMAILNAHMERLKKDSFGSLVFSATEYLCTKEQIEESVA